MTRSMHGWRAAGNEARDTDSCQVKPYRKTSVCNPRKIQYISSMDWQQFIALIIVAGTAGLFVLAKFRRRQFAFGRDTHC